MKKIMGIATIALTIGLLAACGQQQAPAKSSSSVKSSQATSAKPKKAKKPTTTMDFAAIGHGDYTSIAGKWAAVGSKSKNSGFSPEVQSQMTATKQALTIGEVQLAGNKLTTDGHQHPLAFKQTQGTLVATLADADQVAINWAVTFYPKNTTDEFQAITGESGKNQHNMVALWTSNNNVTIVYGQNMPVAKTATTNNSHTAASSSAVSSSQASSSRVASSSSASAPQKPATTASSLNISQLTANNFASLVGTWKNPTTGDTWVVTGQKVTAPAGSNFDPNVGVVVSGHDSNGQPMVITAGSHLTQSGTPVGGYGYFISGPGSPMAPLAILPKGVKASEADDSDSNKDRLITSAGQSGYASEAYYREN
ncbi:DUF6287 domain-containing protein [Lacticaseibacillus sp. GG6-2]